MVFFAVYEFSPRTRGCSGTIMKFSELTRVFPAHAGMFLTYPHGWFGKTCFPRARGDVPHVKCFCAKVIVFSPRTRGCSCPGLSKPASPPVFPAHAGMFPGVWGLFPLD